jgi:hypothetical protein
MPISLLSHVAATAPTPSASRRFHARSATSFVPPAEPDDDEGGEPEEQPRQKAPEDADIKTFAQLLHDAQADARPEDDGAHWPEDSLDPQDLCAFHEEG